MIWPVVPICEAQRRDVRPEDLVQGGLYRLCDTYRGGGGYDRFPRIAQDRGLIRKTEDARTQLVVQLHGCPLRCPYCYVTKDGYLGQPVPVPTDKLIDDFTELHEVQNIRVFHLMGGAPGIYVDRWRELITRLPYDAVFTSDLLLVEGLYDPVNLGQIAMLKNHLIAVNIKGTSPKNYLRNTERPMDLDLIIRNLDVVARTGLNFYLTFTNPDEHLPEFQDMLIARYGPKILRDSFVIDLIDYKATRRPQ